MMEYSHKKLTVWQRAMELTDYVLDLTEQFPGKEQYRLVDQMCRAVVSIPSNIAEGRGKGSDKEFIRYLLIARGSACELDTQLLISHKRNYINQQQTQKACAMCYEITSMLTVLIARLDKNNHWRTTKL
ncbi:four helix bundle protein [Acidaminococcus fermentans]|uniref:four helix bundle protein n=2 Tax=Acidaminococcaceae TaxID=909930 RepID=UPI0008ED626C|nr:four helix bundle protein [Acidaminococcus fermentans]SFO56433.1 four helix bundle protein [Acidaminococcus fermentans]